MLLSVGPEVWRCTVMRRGTNCLEAGVTSGFDSTTESAVTKLMFLFGHGLTPDEVKEHMNCSLIGEVSIPETFRP